MRCKVFYKFFCKARTTYKKSCIYLYGNIIDNLKTVTMKDQTEITINGDLEKQVLKGATILRTEWDGEKWHALVKLPKGVQSEGFKHADDPNWGAGTTHYEFHEQVIRNDKPIFALMSSHRGKTIGQVTKGFLKELYEERYQNERKARKEAAQKEAQA